MGGFSDYYEKECLDRMTGVSPEATRYIALLTAEPDDADTGATITEVSTSGTGYARVATTGSDWNAAVDGLNDKSESSNKEDIIFPAALGEWGTATHFAILDSPTVGAGNVLGWAALTTPRLIDVNDLPAFVAEELKIRLH